MTMDKQEQWKQESAKFNAKLKEHGFKWRKVYEPAERWQLYDNEGTPVTKQWASDYMQALQDWQDEVAIASIISFSFGGVGVPSEAAVTHPDITVISDEGYYVMFAGDTRFLPDASLERHEKYRSANIGRYIVSDGMVFIFDGESFYAESEAKDFAA